MGDRLDPLDEALRLWALLTASERAAFLAAVTDPYTPGGCAREVREQQPTATTRSTTT